MLFLILLSAILVAKAQFPPPQFQFPIPQSNVGSFQSLGQPLPHQIPMQFPFQQKYPAVVMPYVPKKHKNSRKKIKHRRRAPKKIREDSSSQSNSEDETRRSNRGNRRRQVLTPVISYVTKDGYVVYQKKVKRERARDWLDIGRNPDEADN